MEWKDFSTSKLEYPEKLVERTIDGFSNATQGLLQLSVAPVSDVGKVVSRLNNSFQYDCELGSKFVPSYSWEIVRFGYDVDMLKVWCKLDDTVHRQVFGKGEFDAKVVIVNNGEDFINFLEKVFATERFTQVVSGLMKIAEKNRNPNGRL